MNAAVAAPLEELEARLGHTFTRKELLTAALTHASAVTRKRPSSYQRLEFLGDRVLGLAVSELLFEKFPKATEGDMSHRLSQLVRKATCTEVAREWGVGPHVIVGGGELRAGARDSATVLGDICEAILGAIYLDGGYPIARDIVRRYFGARLDATGEIVRDPKTILQEWAQARGKPPPTYDLVSRGGPDHRPTFTVRLTVAGHDPLDAQGASIRAAHQAAAHAFIDALPARRKPKEAREALEHV